jgi:hypothetical protein
VRAAGAFVITLADDLTVRDNDGSDERVRMRHAAAALGEFDRSLHHRFVTHTQKTPERSAPGSRASRTRNVVFFHPDSDRRLRNLT